jgi:hypothetical protein
MLRPKYSCFQYIHGRFDGRDNKEQDVERQVLTGQSTKSWKYRDFFLAYSLPLEKILTSDLLMVPSLAFLKYALNVLEVVRVCLSRIFHTIPFWIKPLLITASLKSH